MIAAIVSLVLASFSSLSSCQRGWWINGVRRDGGFECVLTVGDNDSPPIARIAGHVHCPPSSTPIVIDERHAGCR